MVELEVPRGHSKSRPPVQYLPAGQDVPQGPPLAAVYTPSAHTGGIHCTRLLLPMGESGFEGGHAVHASDELPPT